MTGSLLGGFDNAMVGLTADEVARTADERLADHHDSMPADPADLLDAVAQREIDPRSLALASRLLGVAPIDEVRYGSVRLVLVLTGASHDLPATAGRGVVIGRSGTGASATDVYLAVELAVVSRQHCRVERSGDGVALVDLGSANGTFVIRDGNTHRVATEPFAIQVGDVIATAEGACPLARLESATP